MTNKYPGTCACGVYVEPGQGSAFKSGGGRWGVTCRSGRFAPGRWRRRR